MLPQTSVLPASQTRRQHFNRCAPIPQRSRAPQLKVLTCLTPPLPDARLYPGPL